MVEKMFSQTNTGSRLQSNNSAKLKPDVRRLRASCDGCYLSKVKCTKETPICTRCLNHNMECKYSPSQRVGKPRRLQEERSPKKGMVCNGNVIKTLNPSSTGGVSGYPLLHNWELDFEPKKMSSDAQTGQDAEPPLVWQAPFPIRGSVGGSYDHDSSQSSSVTSPVESLPASHGCRVGSSAVDRALEMRFQRMGSIIYQEDPVLLNSNENVFLEDHFPHMCQNQVQDVSLTFESTSLTPHCTCWLAILEILGELHGESLESSFTRILTTSRSVTSKLAAILSCSCKQNSASNMFIAAAIEQIIAYYRSVGYYSGFDTTAANLAFSSQSASSRSLGIGSHQDGNNQLVILDGLQDMEKLISSLEKKIGRSMVEHEGRLNKELLEFLREELHKVRAM